MNLFELLNDLEARAKAATPGPWKCSAKSFQGLHDIYCGGELIANATNGKFKDAEHIAACSPDTVLALITALREAVELSQDLATRRVLCDDGKATMYLHNVPTVSFFKNESIDIGQKARDWLAKYARRNEG